LPIYGCHTKPGQETFSLDLAFNPIDILLDLKDEDSQSVRYWRTPDG